MSPPERDAARWVEELQAAAQRSHEGAVRDCGLDELLRDVDRAAAREDDVAQQARLRSIGDRLAEARGRLDHHRALPLELLGRALARDVDERADREGWFR